MKTKSGTRIVRGRWLFLGLALAAPALSLTAQTVISGGGNYVSGASFYLGTHTGSPTYGFVQTYDESAADALKLHTNRIASWLWENYDGTTTWPSMRLDQSNNLILYNGTNEGVKLNPVSKSLTLGGSGGVVLTNTTGTTLTTNGALTVAGNFTNTNGSFTGGSTGLSLNAGGTNQNITLSSSAAGDIIFNTNGLERARIKSTGNIGIGTASPSQLLTVMANGAAYDSRVLFSNNTNAHLQLLSGNSSGAHGGGNTGNTLIDFRQNHDLLIGASSDEALTSRANYLAIRGDNGNVGIGTTGPLVPLDVKLATNQHVGAYNNGGVTTFAGLNDAGSLASLRLEGAPLALGGAGGVEHMRISSTGNVGIGTSAPQAKLHVAGSDSAAVGQFSGNTRAVRILTNSTGTILAGTDQTGYTSYQPLYLDGSYLGFNAGGSEKMRMDSAGNVGIGTTSPQGKLHVSDSSGATQFTVGEFYLSTASLPGLTVSAWSNGSVYLDTKVATGGFVRFRYGEGATTATNTWLAMQGGNVGIGTISPGAKLHVQKDGAVVTDYALSQLLVGGTNGNQRLALAYDTASDIGLIQAYVNGGTAKNLILQSGGGNVGIGTTNPTQKLSVAGTIRAYEVVVDTGWSDYVFDADYRLAPLSEVERHIKAEKHLPGIPSAQDVAEHGVSMGDMQSKLLAKVEELTLHLIAQEKAIGALQNENSVLKTRLSTLESTRSLNHE